MVSMSVETAAANFTKAMVDLVGAVRDGAAPAAAAPAAARGPGRPRAPTLEEVKAIAVQVMEKKGQPAAVALIKTHGAEKLAGLDKSKYPAFIAACQVALNEEEEPAEEAGTDDL